MRPTETLTAVLAGRLPPDDAPPWLTASLEVEAYRHGQWVARGATQDQRRERLAEVPDAIREQVETWARRLYRASQP